MTPEQWQAIKVAFDGARQRSPEDRAAFLDTLGDPVVRAEVEALLEAEAAPSLLDDLADAWTPLSAGLRAPREPSPEVPHPEPGEVVGPYQILEEIGYGGMGVVYRARDQRLERDVALKLLPPFQGAQETARARFLAEARAASALDHPNVGTIHDIDETDAGLPYIAMAYYDGETLDAVVARGSMAVDDALRIAVQVAEGLAAAHDAGIIHRDVKPGNVMITRAGRVKLLDFGIAKITGTGMRLTQPGLVLGTVGYMSPEQARGEAIDARTDVWSLGIVLYEMLTGKPPFDAESDHALVYQITHEEPAPLRSLRPDVPEPLSRLVQEMLRKEPVRRPASMHGVIDTLHRMGYASPTVVPSGIRPAVHPPGNRGVWVGAALALSMLMLGVWGWWMLKSADPASPGNGSGNAIAVMYFENLTGDPSLDWVEVGMVEMLTANLAQFDGVEVLSSQRLFDIMAQVAGSGARRIDRSTATVIAQRAGVQTMLLGSVIGDSAHTRLSAQLVAVRTGDLLGTEVVDTGPHGSLLVLADSLTQRIARHLAIRPADQPSTAHVAYTLTNSPEALRAYVEGMEAFYRSDYERAIARFDAATAADSSFAIAYYHRALAYSWVRGEADRVSLEKALRHGDAISGRERELIAATLTMLEDLPTRKTAFEAFTAKYPDEKFAWYQIGEIYYHNYWPHRAVDAFRRATDLDPHFLTAYVHLLDFYFHIDAYDETQPLLDAVLALDSANAVFRRDQAFVDYLRTGTETSRAALIQRLRAEPDNLDALAAASMIAQDFGRITDTLLVFRNLGVYGDEGFVLSTNSLAGIALLQGDVSQTEIYLREAQARAPTSASQAYEAGLFALLRGRPAEAQALADDILAQEERGAPSWPATEALGWHLRLRAMLAAGDAVGARAAFADLEQTAAEGNEYRFLVEEARGRLACAEGRPQAAMRHFDRAMEDVSFTGTNTGVVLLFAKLILDARLDCLERHGDYAALLREADAGPLTVYHYHDFNASTMAVWLHTAVRRARALEALGRTDDAIAAYESVLKLHTGSTLSFVAEARTRLARLRAGR